MKPKRAQPLALLVQRVVSILEKARVGAVRTVNHQMVIAYWLIGREIVGEIQLGKGRAGYGDRVIEGLSSELAGRFQKGFSATNLRHFRAFYLAYADRLPQIQHMPGAEFGGSDVVEDLRFSVAEKDAAPRGFLPVLGWSHYRALVQVENASERLFYEIEAQKQGWSVAHLQRQIHSLLFARLLKSRDKKGVMKLARKGQAIALPSDAIKDPYFLDFLGLPEDERLRESTLESGIVSNLQKFLLELGKGFAFVGRQQRVSTESKHFYMDLVFYNYLLKCFVIFDLKVGELTHQDIGQMDMYVRLFDDQRRAKGDNPTVGIILCAQKDASVVRYSVLHGNERLFASKYRLVLPSEEELRLELDRERMMLTIGKTGKMRRRAGNSRKRVVRTEKKKKKKRQRNVP